MNNTNKIHLNQGGEIEPQNKKIFPQNLFELRSFNKVSGNKVNE